MKSILQLPRVFFLVMLSGQGSTSSIELAITAIVSFLLAEVISTNAVSSVAGSLRMYHWGIKRIWSIVANACDGCLLRFWSSVIKAQSNQPVPAKELLSSSLP